MRMKKQINYYEIGRNFLQRKFSMQFARLILEQQKKWGKRPILFLGIGSDRITGDCLGPLVGYKLERQKNRNFLIEGTLTNPVHAMNLEETIEKVEAMRPKPLVVAMDSSVGCEEHLGLITLGSGGLRPGLGVNKELPWVGEIAITGIVTSQEIDEIFGLQQVPLALVMEMADCISQGIAGAMHLL